jgi:hypothetical protein
MNQEQYTSLEQLTKDLNETLAKAVQTHDPKSQLAMKACSLHQQWIKFYWKEYNPEAHLNLVKMYTEDPRFMEYYNQIAVGSAPSVSSNATFSQNLIVKTQLEPIGFLFLWFNLILSILFGLIKALIGTIH